MPEGRLELRDKFMEFDSEGNCINDGIITAEKIIQNAGGKIIKGVILAASLTHIDWPKDLSDAVEYLVTEWDYFYGE